MINKKISRRTALLGLSSSLLYQAGCSRSLVLRGDVTETVFAHGVASGDPDQSSVVIWTRVSDAIGSIRVDYSVASDSGFRNVVTQGDVATDGSRDHTVKVVLENLQPEQRYYYRFAFDGVSSPVGRTRSLPVGQVDRLVLAIASCSNYAFGFFNAYEVIAADDTIDLVLHLGDYIYEHGGVDSYGGLTGERIGRSHIPAHEIVSLADYRERHAQYKADAQSKAMHARHPIVTIWDDHESTNNSWMAGAEGHQPGEGDWADRRTASLRAYYEWMPVREPGAGGSREEYWRHLKFGDLASIVTLEGRLTGRSKQIPGWDIAGKLETRAQAQDFMTTVVGAPDREMLSQEMQAFLTSSLRESVESGIRWRVIANPTILARSVVPNFDHQFFEALKNAAPQAHKRLDILRRLGRLGLPDGLDDWNGYPAARDRFYESCQDAGAHDLLVVTGDSHKSWVNSLYDSDGKPMGVELGTPGITSPSGFRGLGHTGARRYFELLADENKEVEWVDIRFQGFIRLVLNTDRAHAEFVAVSDVESRIYQTSLQKAIEIEHRDDSLHYPDLGSR